MHLILTGATGLIGSSALDAMLKSKDVTKITILSRRPVDMARNQPKVNVIIHEDFSRFEPEVLSRVRDADGLVWALGISQAKVSKSKYVKITKDFPVAAASALATLRADSDRQFRFIYVSSGGATTTPGLFTPSYGLVKGEAEAELAKHCTPNISVHSVRPFGVDASNHDAIQQYIPDPGMSYRIMSKVLVPVISTVFRSLHCPTEHLGPFLVGLALGRYGEQLEAGGDGISSVGQSKIIENSGFRRLYGLP